MKIRILMTIALPLFLLSACSLSRQGDSKIVYVGSIETLRSDYDIETKYKKELKNVDTAIISMKCETEDGIDFSATKEGDSTTLLTWLTVQLDEAEKDTACDSWFVELTRHSVINIKLS